IDVARIKEGQPVTLTLDAFSDLELPGRVARIGLLSTEQSAVTAYTVRIETSTNNPLVRSGMSANADIIIDRVEHALVVPRRAVTITGGNQFVETPKDQSLCDANPVNWPLQPELTSVAVKTGLSNESAITIVAGDLNEHSCVYVAGIDARATIFGGN